MSYIYNDSHTIRSGFAVTGEQTNVSNVSTVLPGDVGAVTGPPFNITDQTSLLGWNIGTYVQDEWKITNQLTVNAGLRFDQFYQFVDANQLSPRFAVVYKPFDGTTIHAGYARYFTPPYQAQATQSNIALFANTTNQPDQFICRSRQARTLALFRRRRGSDRAAWPRPWGSTPITRWRGT